VRIEAAKPVLTSPVRPAIMAAAMPPWLVVAAEKN